MTHTIVLNLINNTLTESWEITDKHANGPLIETETVPFPAACGDLADMLDRHRYLSFYRLQKGTGTAIYKLIK